MVDRVAATITIGGTLPSSHLETFVELIENEALAPEWDGEPFTIADLPADGPLMLMASEVALGEFRELESFCVAHRLSFARWHQSNCGTWGGERAVFTARATCEFMRRPTTIPWWSIVRPSCGWARPTRSSPILTTLMPCRPASGSYPTMQCPSQRLIVSCHARWRRGSLRPL